METPKIKKSVVQKYAQILQVDTKSPPPSKSVFSSQASPEITSKGPFLAKLSLAPKAQDTFVPVPNRTYSHHFLKTPSPKFDLRPMFQFDSSSILTAQKKLKTLSEQIATASSVEEKSITKGDETVMRGSHPITAREWLSIDKSTRRDLMDTGYLNTSSGPKSVRVVNVAPLERVTSFEDSCRGMKDVNLELIWLMNDEHEKNLKSYMKILNVKDFKDLQKARINTIIKVIEKAFVMKGAKEPGMINPDLWKLLCNELHKSRCNYEEFLLTLEDTVEKVSKGKKKVYDHTKPWEAINLIVDHSFLTREMDIYTPGEKREKVAEALQKIYQFKLDYKVSKDFNQRILEMYELVETHIRELNQLVENEREKHKTMDIQYEKLVKLHSEQEAQYSALKGEMMDMIHRSKKGDNRLSYIQAPTAQEEVLKKHTQTLETENIKLFEENTQLRKEQKELKGDLKKAIMKAEKTFKPTSEKGVMVDLYNSNVRKLRPKGLAPYVSEPALCVSNSELPQGFMVSIMNLMLSDKMITDICDDFERRPRKPLKLYVTEWFLKRFGFYDFCEIMLQDFVFTLHSVEGGDRFNVFRQLLGTPEKETQAVFRFSLDRPTQIDRGKLRRMAFSTAEVLKQFHRIVNCVKTVCVQGQDTIFPTHNYGPYLLHLESNSLVSYEAARNILQIIMKEANFSIEERRDAEDYLQLRIQEQELQNRMLEPSTEEKVDNMSNGNIDFDVFVRFLLEAVVEKHIRTIERYYAALKVHVIAQKESNIPYEEYGNSVNMINPEASQAWKDHSFARMMSYHNAAEVPLAILIENLVDSYFNVDKAENTMKTVSEKDIRSIGEIERNSARSSQLVTKKTGFLKPGSTTPSQNPLFRPNSSRQKLFTASKEGISLGNATLNEMGYDMYDAVSSLIVLQETYALAEASIKAAEKSTDNVVPLHETFVKGMELFPKQVINLNKLDPILVFTKEELVDGLEYLWSKFRALIVHAFRKKEKD